MSRLKRITSRLVPAPPNLSAVERKLDTLAVLHARTLMHEIAALGDLRDLRQAEFSVYSQFGDDGIIQYLVRRLAPLESFVEFGVSDYREASTRFLLVNNNWSGLVMDGSAQNVAAITRDAISWRHDLTSAAEFIDSDNIDAILERHGFTGGLGLLSIDIDGNDYWVWQAISVVEPLIVMAEYNSLFGSERAVVVPYDPAFDRLRAHFSGLYWGASLGALALLAERKGYRFVGSNSAGNNAYFVRAEAAGRLPSPTVRDGYVRSKFRESRDQTGELTHLRGEDRLAAIEHLPVYDLERDETVLLRELTGASE